MFRQSLASVVSAALLMVGPGPLSAQMMSRGPVAVSVTPTIGAGLNSPVPGASSNIPTLAPVGALTASIVPAAPVPVAAVQPQALAPVTAQGSPLAVIRSQDPAVGVDKKGAALDVLFDQSAAAVDGTAAGPILGQPEPAKPSAPNAAGIVLGLTAAARALESRTSGYGNVDFWVHHHAMRRDIGNAVADSLTAISRATDDRLLAFELQRLAEDLRAAPQKGYGNVDYWTDLCSRQDTAFARIASRLRQLNDLPRP